MAAVVDARKADDRGLHVERGATELGEQEPAAGELEHVFLRGAHRVGCLKQREEAARAVGEHVFWSPAGREAGRGERGRVEEDAMVAALLVVAERMLEAHADLRPATRGAPGRTRGARRPLPRS